MLKTYCTQYRLFCTETQAPSIKKTRQDAKKQIDFLDIVLSLVQLFLLNVATSQFFQASGQLPVEPAQNAASAAALTLSVIFFVVYEELLFRLFLIEIFRAISCSTLASVLVSSLLFSFAHRYMGAGGLVFSFFAGLVLSLLYVKSKGIWASVLVHALYNILILLMFDFYAYTSA